MTNNRTRRHELTTASSQGFFGTHTILVSQFAFHNVCDDFHVAMGMCTKATIWLDQAIIHYTEDTKVGISIVIVLGKTEMESRLKPIFVGPLGV
jgi:hypothetical protein